MNKLRFGIVGTGNIAHRFANAIKNVEQAQLVAVASRTQTGADRFADEFCIENRFSSYEAMAESDLIDVAYIAVPHSGHKECSCLMMNNGKHVICEKPIAVNSIEAEEMFACARKNGVFLMEAMWARLVPGTIKLIELINEGIIGEIRGVEGSFCYSLDEDEMDHHVARRENGGGSLLDVGIYGLYFSSWYLGDKVEKITADASIVNGVDAHTAINLKYENGAIARLSGAILLHKPNEGYIFGTKGYVHVGHFYAPDKIEIFFDDDREETLNIPYAGNGFEEQIKHVCECISSGLTQSPILTHDAGRFIMRQMDEIRGIIGVEYPQDSTS